MLYVRIDCSDVGGCTFHLKDENVGDFAAALPLPENLHLGRPCHDDSCDTTTASLSISTHYLDLVILETHFNTLTIVDDVQRLVGGGATRDKTKCRLRYLMSGNLPL